MITTLNNTVSRKPSIVDAIIKQGVATAPLLEMMGTGSIAAPKHSWINDRFADAKDNAHVELTDLGGLTTPTKGKTENVSQIIKNEVGVTRRELSMSHYGEKTWSYEVGKKGKEHLKDIEFAFLGLGHSATTGVFSPPVEGTASKAPRMGGIFHFIPNDQRADYEDSGNPVDLTDDHIHEFLEPLWKKGAMEDETFTILLGSQLKRKVNKLFKDYLQKDATGGKFDPTITTIATDFGDVKFRLHRHFAGSKLNDKMLAGQFKEAKAMYVEKTNFNEVPTSKTAKYGRYYTDVTLEVKNGDKFASLQGVK